MPISELLTAPDPSADDFLLSRAHRILQDTHLQADDRIWACVVSLTIHQPIVFVEAFISAIARLEACIWRQRSLDILKLEIV